MKNKYFSGVLIFFSLFISNISYSQWVSLYNSGGNNDDKAYAITVDNAGNSYVTGNAVTLLTQASHITTIKYSFLGTPLWIQTFRLLNFNTDDKAYAITVDNPGNNTYVAGSMFNSATNSNDMVLIKYNNLLGTEVWSRTFNGSGNSDDKAYAITVDGPGNITITGYTTDNSDKTRITTLQYDPNGNLLWSRIFNGNYEFDKAYAITVDNAGNIILTGYAMTSNDEDLIIMKYSPAGNMSWQKIYDGPAWGPDRGIAVKCGNNNEIYAAGSSQGNGTGMDYVVLKYDANGNVLRTLRYDGPGNDDDILNSAVISNPTNQIFVTGSSRSTSNSGSEDYATVCWDINTGAQLWARRFNGSGNGIDIPYKVTTDDYNFVYVTGSSKTSGTASEIKNLRYDYAGNLNWSASYSGTGNSDNCGYDLAVDTFGDLMVTGFATNLITGRDYVTIMYLKALVSGINQLGTGIPDKFNLYQNYPNPFNPSTNIKFDLPSESNVKIKVYDIMGKIVDIIADRQLNPGTYQVTWNAENNASGIYYYTIETNNFKSTKKMLMVK